MSILNDHGGSALALVRIRRGNLVRPHATAASRARNYMEEDQKVSQKEQDAPWQTELVPVQVVLDRKHCGERTVRQDVYVRGPDPSAWSLQQRDHALLHAIKHYGTMQHQRRRKELQKQKVYARMMRIIPIWNRGPSFARVGMSASTEAVSFSYCAVEPRSVRPIRMAKSVASSMLYPQ